MCGSIILQNDNSLWVSSAEKPSDFSWCYSTSVRSYSSGRSPGICFFLWLCAGPGEQTVAPNLSPKVKSSACHKSATNKMHWLHVRSHDPTDISWIPAPDRQNLNGSSHKFWRRWINNYSTVSNTEVNHVSTKKLPILFIFAAS